MDSFSYFHQANFIALMFMQKVRVSSNKDREVGYLMEWFIQLLLEGHLVNFQTNK